MEFRILNQADYKIWNQFVDRSPQGSIFAKTFYLDAIGLPYQIGVLQKNDTIKGGIVLAKNELHLFSNPLFAKYLGVLLCPIESRYVNRITEEKRIIERIVANLKYRSFDYTFHPEFKNWLPFHWRGYRQTTRYTYRICNLKDFDKIMENMHSRVRKNLRKAEKHYIAIDEEISLKDFYQINKLSFKRQGGPIPYSFAFFKKFYNRLKQYNAIKLFGAKDKDNRIHTVGGIVYDSKECYFLFNGNNPEIPNKEANTLLIIRTIEYAAGFCETFDFEGSMIEPIERFYRGFGGQMTPYMNIWKANALNTVKRNAIAAYKKLRYGK
jgi:hypothetical protein